MYLKSPALLGATLLTLVSTSAQLKAEEYGRSASDDILDRPAVAGIGLARPGIFVDFTQSDTLDFEDGTDGLDLINIRTRLPVWGIKTEELLYSMSFRYEYTNFETDSLGERDLNKLRLGIQVLHDPKDSGWLGLLRFEPGLAFESGAFDGDGFDLTTIGVAGYKFSEKFVAAVGFYSNYGFDDFVFYPSAGFIWQPADNLHLQVTPPIINLAWSPNNKWVFFINTYPAGGSWLLDEDQDRLARELDLQLFRASIGVEYAITDNLRVAVRGGMNFFAELEVRDADHRVLADDDLDPSPFYAVTLTWAF